MKFGLFSMNMGPCSYPEAAITVAQAAEAAGFESLWAGEHVVLPDPQVPPSPMAPEDRTLDPVVALTFIAAHTRTIRLGTGIIILPQRNPLVLAKELASLDVVSGGRLIFGVGAGYLEPEFRALGVPYEHRGPRTVEYVQAMNAIWSEQKPEFHGRFVSYAGVQAHPQPVQQPHPPIVMGGSSPAAYGRAVQLADGWYGFALDLAGTERAIQGLHAAAQRQSRPRELGDLEISVTPRGAVDLETARQFAELGVHRLIVLPRRGSGIAAIQELIQNVGETLIGAV